jgi:hypothetical protein
LILKETYDAIGFPHRNLAEDFDDIVIPIRRHCIGSVGMSAVPIWRLNGLRFVYALIAIAMGSMTWPAIITHSGDWSFMPGVVKCMLGALTLLALFGIRYPLQMLPLLFWELAWKTIWLLAVALPAWMTNSIDVAMAENIFATALVVIVYAAIPWRYVFDRYVTRSGDPWRSNS